MGRLFCHGNKSGLIFRDGSATKALSHNGYNIILLMPLLKRGTMNYPAAELRGIKMNFYLINPDAEHRRILLIKIDRKTKTLTS
jgi:hypothetical protein